MTPRAKTALLVALFALGGSSLSTAASADTIAIQPDGKIVLAGSAPQGKPHCIAPVGFFRCYFDRLARPAAIRLDAGGNPDPTFGFRGGIVDFRAPLIEGPKFRSLALLPGGDIRLGWGGMSALRITGLEIDGDPSWDFGRDGLAIAPTTANASNMTALLPQPDGSLVAGVEVIKFEPKTFAATSSAAVAMPLEAAGGEASPLGEVSADRRIAQLVDLVPLGNAFIAVGSLRDVGRYSGFLARFPGSTFPYDPAFGGGTGLVELASSTDSGEGRIFYSAAADGDRVMVAGSDGGHPLLVRYTADGQLDQSFGEGGLLSFSIPASLTSLPIGFGSAEARAVVVQPDGRYVVAGSARVNALKFCDMKSPMCSRAFLARFEPNGSLDTSFGDGGFVMDRVSKRVPWIRFDVVLQPDGKILLSDAPLHVARYGADGRLDMGFGERGEAGFLPCQDTISERRRSGCVSKATITLGVRGRGNGRPRVQLSVRASNALDPLASVKLLLPAELTTRESTASKAKVLTVPRHRARVSVRPHMVSVGRLANARGVHVGIGSGGVYRMGHARAGQKRLFRVEVRFKDGTSSLFKFR